MHFLRSFAAKWLEYGFDFNEPQDPTTCMLPDYKSQ